MTTDYDSFDACATFAFTATEHFARNLRSGYGFMFGGSYEGSQPPYEIASNYRYDVLADSWAAQATLPQGARQLLGTYDAGAGRIGMAGSRRHVLDDETWKIDTTDEHYKYTTTTDTYGALATLPYDPVTDHTERHVRASQFDGYAWIVGGYSVDVGTGYDYTDAVARYTYASNTWATETPFVIVTSLHNSTTIDAAMHVTGGMQYDPPEVPYTYYDHNYAMTFPTSVVWTAKTPMLGIWQGKRYFHGAEWVAEHLTTVGGREDDGGGMGSNTLGSDVWEYSTTGTWTRIGDYPEAQASMCTFAPNGTLVSVCGEGLCSTTQRLSNATKTWETRTAEPVATANARGGVGE